MSNSGLVHCVFGRMMRRLLSVFWRGVRQLVSLLIVLYQSSPLGNLHMFLRTAKSTKEAYRGTGVPGRYGNIAEERMPEFSTSHSSSS